MSVLAIKRSLSLPFKPWSQAICQKYAIQIIQIEQKLPVAAPSAKKSAEPLWKQSSRDWEIARPDQISEGHSWADALQLIPEVMARRLNLIPISIANKHWP